MLIPPTQLRVDGRSIDAVIDCINRHPTYNCLSKCRLLLFTIDVARCYIAMVPMNDVAEVIKTRM